MPRVITQAIIYFFASRLFEHYVGNVVMAIQLMWALNLIEKKVYFP